MLSRAWQAYKEEPQEPQFFWNREEAVRAGYPAQTRIVHPGGVLFEYTPRLATLQFGKDACQLALPYTLILNQRSAVRRYPIYSVQRWGWRFSPLESERERATKIIPIFSPHYIGLPNTGSDGVICCGGGIGVELRARQRIDAHLAIQDVLHTWFSSLPDTRDFEDWLNVITPAFRETGQFKAPPHWVNHRRSHLDEFVSSLTSTQQHLNRIIAALEAGTV